MSEEKEKSHCATCEHNVGNYCTSYDGYYVHGEAISDEEVECKAWEVNPYSYSAKLKAK